MKKLLFILLMEQAIFSVHGQEQPKKAFFPLFFIVAGPNFSTIGGGDSWKWAVLGPVAGVGCSIDPGEKDHIVYRAEANLSIIGAKYDEGGGYPGSTGKVTLTYVNVPLVIQYKRGNFFAEGGVQPSFLAGAKDKYASNNEDYKYNTKSFDMGIPIGVGCVFMHSLGVNLRYVHGLSKINKDNDEKDRNRVISLRFFWLLTFNKK
jgi:Outer membrane protein beta-barrel domain